MTEDKTKMKGTRTVSSKNMQVKARRKPNLQHRPPLELLSLPPSTSFTNFKSTEVHHNTSSTAVSVFTHSLAFQTETSGNTSLPWQNLTKEVADEQSQPCNVLQEQNLQLEATIENLKKELSVAQQRALDAERNIEEMKQELSDTQNRLSMAEKKMTDPRRELFRAQNRASLAENNFKDIQARRLKDYEILSLCRTSTNSILSDFLIAHQESTESRVKHAEAFQNSMSKETRNFQRHLDNIPVTDAPSDEVLEQASALLKYISVTKKHRERYLSRTAAIDKQYVSDTKAFKRSLGVVDDEYFEKQDDERRRKRRRRPAIEQYP